MANTNDLLRRIARAVETRTVGLVDTPPGRTVLFANVVQAPDGCLWYSWNPNEQVPISVERRNVRGRLTDLYCYEKASGKGTTVKVRASLDCGLTTYDIETSLYNPERDTLVTSGKMLVAGLRAALPAIGEGRMVTVGARPAQDPDARDQVLFLDVYTDAGQVRYDQAPSSKEGAYEAVGQVRGELGTSTDPFDNPISNRDPSQPDPHEGGPSGGRQKHPSEEVYDSGGAPHQQPPPRGQSPGQPDTSGTSAANPSGDPVASGTSGKAGNRRAMDPLPKPHGALVACPTCGAEPEAGCVDREAGEVLEVQHDSRVTLAHGLAGSAEDLLQIIEPHLQRREGAELKEVITDLAERTGKFPEAEWEIIAQRVTPYHEEAADILDSFREPPTQ